MYLKAFINIGMAYTRPIAAPVRQATSALEGIGLTGNGYKPHSGDRPNGLLA